MALTGIANSKVDALNTVRLNKVANVDITVGTLMGYDTTLDKWVKANGVVASGDIVKPVTICVKGSPDAYGEALDLRPAGTSPTIAVLKAGAEQDGVKYAVLQYSAGHFTDADVAGMAPLYLGAEGVVTKTAPSATGDFKKIVGYVLTHDSAMINLEIDLLGETVA